MAGESSNGGEPSSREIRSGKALDLRSTVRQMVSEEWRAAQSNGFKQSLIEKNLMEYTLSLSLSDKFMLAD